jgi:hypothetical protein
VLPFGFWWQWFADVWPATELEAQFCGGEALTADLIVASRPQLLHNDIGRWRPKHL